MIHFYTPFLLGIIIVLLHSHIKLKNNYNQIKYEYDDMAHHVLDIYNQVCRLNKASKRMAGAKASSARTRKKPAVKQKRTKTNLK
jgi:hypothetical protein